MRALLIGRPPLMDLGHSYVAEPPYDGVVIGSLELTELICFAHVRRIGQREYAVFGFAADGMPFFF